MSKADDFIKEFPFITGLGFDPQIVYTHASHESAGFSKVIGDFNFWGIKNPKKWTGKSVQVLTHEYINSQWIETYANFIDFDDLKSAIVWYSNFIQRLYPEAYKARTDYKIYFISLVSYSYKYATDPNYAPLLIRLYEEIFPEGGE